MRGEVHWTIVIMQVLADAVKGRATVKSGGVVYEGDPSSGVGQAVRAGTSAVVTSSGVVGVVRAARARVRASSPR